MITTLKQIERKITMKTATCKTPNEIDKMVSAGKLRRLHTSYFRGYVSRRGAGYAISYKGKFGEGYKLLSPCWASSQYAFVTYFVK